MYISKIKIFNYKSYLESEEIPLSRGFNLIVGQNNAGKTALLEAVSLNFQSKPHFSEKTVPKPGYQYNPHSKINLSFTLIKNELKETFLNFGGNIHIPNRGPSGDGGAITKFLKKLDSDSNTFNSLYNASSSSFENAYLDSFGTWLPTDQVNYYSVLHKLINTTEYSFKGNTNYKGIHSEYCGLVFLNIFKDKIYKFNAERLNLSSCNFGTSQVLNSNASNLAEVLNNLQSSNPERYKRFIKALNFIFPQINHVSIVSKDSNNVEIKIWTVDPKSERKDLSVSLSESGSGIGQVLAILYVVLNTESPIVILIDEPQSFLHPGAARKLIEVLKSHPQHQYIISTHSPTIVSACNAKSIILVKNIDGESKTELIDSEEIHSLRLFLTDVGVKLSDVFGADHILWVEGKTEEVCFPMIFEKSGNTPVSGIEILGVKQTGDFEGKHKKTVFEIYKRLSEGRNLLPPAIGFIFDQEGRSDKDITDLTRQSSGKVNFLPRRLYENYLLSPKAISEIATSIDGFNDEPITEDIISKWIEENKWQLKYFDKPVQDSDKSDEFWIKNVHGAKLLESIFTELSETRVSYDKTIHSVQLTKWLLENDISYLEEVCELLNSILCASSD